MRGKSLLTSSSDDVKRRTHGKSGEGGGARGGGASKFYEKIKLPEAAEIATMLRQYVPIPACSFSLLVSSLALSTLH